MFPIDAHKRHNRMPWSDLAHSARHLIRAYDMCSAIRYLFADDVKYMLHYMHNALQKTLNTIIFYSNNLKKYMLIITDILQTIWTEQNRTEQIFYFCNFYIHSISLHIELIIICNSGHIQLFYNSLTLMAPQCRTYGLLYKFAMYTIK